MPLKLIHRLKPHAEMADRGDFLTGMYKEMN